VLSESVPAERWVTLLGR